MRYDKANRKRDALEQELSSSKAEAQSLRKQLEHISGVLRATMHEIRRFSGELTANSEQLSKLCSADGSLQKYEEIVQTIYFTSGMLAARLGFTDIELNPAIAKTQIKIPINIYKKFDKARYILAQSAKQKQIHIRFDGQSFSEFHAIQSFELVPFVLLENAIKYSPKSNEVLVKFEESRSELLVTVTSLGPICKKSELTNIFEKGVRGDSAKNYAIGDGLGLYLVRLLSDLHGIRVLADSEQVSRFQISGVSVSPFKIQLRFPK